MSEPKTEKNQATSTSAGGSDGPGKIFISYSRNDKDDVMPYVTLMRQNGLDVWMDESSINASAEWAGQIVNAITACDVFVLFLSETSVESENVRKEIGLAASLNRKILPLKIEDVEIPPSLLYHLNSIHFLEAEKISHDQLLEHVFNAAGRSLEDARTAISDASPGKKKPGLTPLAIIILALALLAGGYAVISKKDAGNESPTPIPAEPKIGSKVIVSEVRWLNPDEYDAFKIRFKITNNHPYAVSNPQVAFQFLDVTGEELKGDQTKTITQLLEPGEVKEIMELDLGAYPRDATQAAGRVISATKVE